MSASRTTLNAPQYHAAHRDGSELMKSDSVLGTRDSGLLDLLAELLACCERTHIPMTTPKGHT